MFNVTFNDTTFSLSAKTPIKNLIKPEDDKKYYAAKVNNRLRELTYELSFDSTVELLDKTHYDAIKVYETSLRYLLALAFRNLYPSYSIRISYNISRSLMVSILEPNNVIVDSKMVKAIKTELDRLVSLDLPFVRKTISKEEAVHHPKKNMLTKALGCTSFVEPDVSVKGFLKDDILVLTSDGLTNMVTDQEIYDIVTENIEVATDKLIEKANAAGGLDNITVVVVLNKNT